MCALTTPLSGRAGEQNSPATVRLQWLVMPKQCHRLLNLLQASRIKTMLIRRTNSHGNTYATPTMAVETPLERLAGNSRSESAIGDQKDREARELNETVKISRLTRAS